MTSLTDGESSLGAADRSGHGVIAIGDPGQMLGGLTAGALPTWSWPPDIAAAAYEQNGVEIRAASVRGLLHRAPRSCGPRQDAFGVVADGSRGTIVAVVCDGVGTLKESHVAANFVSDRLPASYLRFGSWQSAIAELNDQLARIYCPFGENGEYLTMATTVVGFALVPDHEGWSVRSAAIGDSELWSLDQGTWRRILPNTGPDDETEVSSGTTRALPVPGSVRVHEVEFRLNTGDAIFLMTDGVGTPLVMSTEVANCLADYWRDPPDPFTFGSQVGFARRSFVDDRTVVGCWVTEKPDTPAAPEVDHSDAGHADGLACNDEESSDSATDQVVEHVERTANDR